MFRRIGLIVLVAALLGVTFALEREARRREQLADKNEAELLRIQNDQADLTSARLRLRAARDAQETRQNLRPLQKRQRQFLEILKPLHWTVLEWEEAGFYLEAPDAERLPWSPSTRAPGRLAGHWQ